MCRRPSLFLFPAIFKDTAVRFSHTLNLAEAKRGAHWNTVLGPKACDSELCSLGNTLKAGAYPFPDRCNPVLLTRAHTPLHPETHPPPHTHTYTGTLLCPRDARTPASKHHTQLPRTCAPSEHQSCTHQTHKPQRRLRHPHSARGRLRSSLSRSQHPSHSSPRPQLSTEDSREGRGRSAPPRSTRGCTRPGPLGIDTASTQSRGPRHRAWGFYAVPKAAAAEGTQVAQHPHSWLRQMQARGATPWIWPCRYSVNLCSPDSGCPRRRGLADHPSNSTLAAQGGSAVRTPVPNSKSRLLTPT